MKESEKTQQAIDQSDFSKGDIRKVILRMAVPLTLAQLVNVLYNLVDRMYIGHMPINGDIALTGLGVALPLATVTAAFGNFCAYGGVPLFAIARGEGDDERASRIMGHCLTISVILGLALTAAFLTFKEPLLYAFGASAETFGYANDYAGIYALGTIFVSVTLGLNGFISAQGFAKVGMLTVVLGAVINTVLDPIFIYTFNMGVKGAALATIIAQFCSMLWILRFLTGKKAALPLKTCYLRLELKTSLKIFSLGATGFFLSITNSAVQIVSNATLQRYGGDLYVGVMTVINSVVEFGQIAIRGLTQATQPIIGYNYGARQWRRVDEIIRFSTLVGILYTTTLWAIVMLFPEFLIRIFNNKPALVAAGIPAMRLNFSLYLFMSLQFSAQAVFVGIGRAKNAIFFSLLRKAIIMLPLIVLLPRVASLGISGVFLAEPISEVLGGGAAYLAMYLLVWRPVKGLIRREEQEPSALAPR